MISLISEISIALSSLLLDPVVIQVDSISLLRGLKDMTFDTCNNQNLNF